MHVLRFLGTFIQYSLNCFILSQTVSQQTNGATNATIKLTRPIRTTRWPVTTLLKNQKASELLDRNTYASCVSFDIYPLDMCWEMTFFASVQYSRTVIIFPQSLRRRTKRNCYRNEGQDLNGFLYSCLSHCRLIPDAAGMYNWKHW